MQKSRKILIGFVLGIIVIALSFLGNDRLFKGTIRRLEEDTLQTFCERLWGTFGAANGICQYAGNEYADTDTLVARHDEFPQVCAGYQNLGAVWHDDSFECEFRGVNYESEGHLTSILAQFETWCRAQRNTIWSRRNEFTCRVGENEYGTIEEASAAFAIWINSFREFCIGLPTAEWKSVEDGNDRNHCLWGIPQKPYMSKNDMEIEIRRLKEACGRVEGAQWEETEKKCIYQNQTYYSAGDLLSAVDAIRLAALCQATEGAIWNEQRLRCRYNDMNFRYFDQFKKAVDQVALRSMCDSIPNAAWIDVRNGEGVCRFGGHDYSSTSSLENQIQALQNECAITESAIWLDNEKACEYQSQKYFNAQNLIDIRSLATLQTLCARGNGTLDNDGNICVLFDVRYAALTHLSEYNVEHLRLTVDNIDFVQYCRSLINANSYWKVREARCDIGAAQFAHLAELQTYVDDLKNICSQLEGLTWNEEQRSCTIREGIFYNPGPLREAISVERFRRRCEGFEGNVWNNDETCTMEHGRVVSSLEFLERMIDLIMSQRGSPIEQACLGTESAEWSPDSGVCMYLSVPYASVETLEAAVENARQLRELCTDEKHNGVFSPTGDCTIDGEIYRDRAALERADVAAKTALREICQQTPDAQWNEEESICSFDGGNFTKRTTLVSALDEIKRNLQALCEATSGAEWRNEEGCAFNNANFKTQRALQAAIETKQEEEQRAEEARRAEAAAAEAALAAAAEDALVPPAEAGVAPAPAEEGQPERQIAGDEEDAGRIIAAAGEREGEPSAASPIEAEAGVPPVPADAEIPTPAPAPAPAPEPAPAGGGGGGGGAPIVSTPARTVAPTSQQVAIVQINNLANKLTTLKTEFASAKTPSKKREISKKIKAVQKELIKIKDIGTSTTAIKKKADAKKSVKKVARKKKTKDAKKLKKKPKSLGKGALSGIETIEVAEGESSPLKDLAFPIVVLTVVLAGGIYYFLKKRKLEPPVTPAP